MPIVRFHELGCGPGAIRLGLLDGTTLAYGLRLSRKLDEEEMHADVGQNWSEMCDTIFWEIRPNTCEQLTVLG